MCRFSLFMTCLATVVLVEEYTEALPPYNTFQNYEPLESEPSEGKSRSFWWADNATGRVGRNPCVPRKVLYSLEEYSLCGDGRCLCRGDTADCSFNVGQLKYVPKLPLGITQLLFTDNALTAIPSDDFFQNVTNISFLDLGNNDLEYISPGAFLPLTNLTTLGLLRHKLNYVTLAPVLSVSTLKLLDISENQHLGTPPDDLFHRYPLPHLEMLCLSFAGISELNMSVFTPLERLKGLQIGGNRLSQFSLHTTFLPQMTETLMLTANAFSGFVETCRDGISLFPNLTWLDLSFNPSIISAEGAAICLPNLQLLSLMNSNLYQIAEGALGEDTFPSLKYLALSGSNALTRINRYAFRNPRLLLVHLSHSRLDFASDNIHPDSLAGCPNLKMVDVDDNDFSAVTEEKFIRLFGHVTGSLALSLKSTNMARVTAGMFSHIKYLRYLYLNSNKISDIPDGAFDALEYLQELHLPDNGISTVRETTFSAATRRRLKLLDLSGNPFQCTCELRWFQNWLQSQPSLFASLDNYMCDNMVNTTVQSFFVADQACLWSPEVSKFIIASIVMFVFPLFAGIALYRYRWHIRLVLYEAFRGRGDRWRRLHEENFQYDVFVSYDCEDVGWVQEHLMPTLEGRMGLKLCIHQRDFTPGAPIVENITEAVEASKKVMMLFSPNFVHSPWCQFELHLCLTFMLEREDSLLVVLLSDIPSRDLTPAMMAVMKTTTYIEWADEPEARASFWGRIQLALHEIVTEV